ncbi:MAG: T9SS type A sorting domain-containing protein [Bacteroidota bacterium]|nr:T9SS type A sorting domain-containing protein [Bacteroidota bacterium]
MKHTILFIAICLILFSSMLLSQTINHPWWVVDRGGGKSSGGELTLQTSIGQNAIQKMTGDTFALESGYIPGLRNLAGTSTTLGISMSAGWNLLSVPLLVNDYRKSVLFPTAVSPAYAYQDGYKVKDTLSNGAGYWLKFSSSTSIPISGTAIMLDTIDVNARWNMIGVVSYPVLISEITPVPPVTIQSQYFGYTSTGYYTEDTLKPGYAYWLKVNQSGKIVLKSGSVLMASSQSVMVKTQNKPDDIKSIAEEKGLRSLTLKDEAGREQTLYFTAKPVEIDLEKYELPPIPPSGVFDVRFQSQRNVEVADKEKSDKQEFPIKISGAKYPLTINWDASIDEEQEYTLEVKSVNEYKIVSKVFILDTKEKSLTIDEEVLSVKLIMSAKSVVEIPKEYVLYQNYPNPFNPTTKIKYDLPIASKVILKVYNVLGQEVATLVDEMQEAGFKSVELDGTNLSSGVYFYRLMSNALSTSTGHVFISTKKIILLK